MCLLYEKKKCLCEHCEPHHFQWLFNNLSTECYLRICFSRGSNLIKDFLDGGERATQCKMKCDCLLRCWSHAHKNCVILRLRFVHRPTGWTISQARSSDDKQPKRKYRWTTTAKMVNCVFVRETFFCVIIAGGAGSSGMRTKSCELHNWNMYVGCGSDGQAVDSNSTTLVAYQCTSQQE